jgi:predicted nucleotide-binding protein
MGDRVVSSSVVCSVVMSAVARQLLEFIDAAAYVGDFEHYEAWRRRVQAFLDRAIPADAIRFEGIRLELLPSGWNVVLSSQRGLLEALAAEAEDVEGALSARPGSAANAVSAAAALLSKKVFVVHGHDNAAKETVARFLEHLGLEAVILHEKPNEGRTVIEKFERHADVGFAVVLLTPDDTGAPATRPSFFKPRARQNVVLELGYFLGHLGRSRVCALYKEGVEIPSDYRGVIYVEFDDKGAWRRSLAQELTNAGLKISLDALLKS